MKLCKIVCAKTCLCVCMSVSRCSLMGFDLNRHWQDPSPWAHPTLHAVKQLIVQMNQDPVSEQAHSHTHTPIHLFPPYCAQHSFPTEMSTSPGYGFLPPCLVQHVPPICVQGVCALGSVESQVSTSRMSARLSWPFKKTLLKQDSVPSVSYCNFSFLQF